ncbi:MAG: hypothetical protein ACREQ5_34660, partial [Candidatus Dormibacteria bacterium]
LPFSGGADRTGHAQPRRLLPVAPRPRMTHGSDTRAQKEDQGNAVRSAHDAQTRTAGGAGSTAALQR